MVRRIESLSIAYAISLLAVLHLGGCIDFLDKIACTEDDHCPVGNVCDRGRGDEIGFCLEVGRPCSGDAKVWISSFRIDAFEASRADATSTFAGDNELLACSVGGVLPWTDTTKEEADRACRLSGKRLCTEDELEEVCRGSEDWEFPYGNDYVQGRCNDAKASIGDVYVTGGFENCVDSTGKVFDLVGNVSEHFWIYSTYEVTYGGSYQDSNLWDVSDPFAACSGTSTGDDSGPMAGFRCCED